MAVEISEQRWRDFFEHRNWIESRAAQSNSLFRVLPRLIVGFIAIGGLFFIGREFLSGTVSELDSTFLVLLATFLFGVLNAIAGGIVQQGKLAHDDE